MTIVHLVRHGQTDWNLERRIQGQTNSQLTDLGRQQARDASFKLKNVHIDHVFSSSSTRALETARLIMEGRDIELLPHDALREIQLGHWEGNLYDEIKEREPENYHHFWQDPSQFNVPGAETFHQLQQRGLSVLNELVEKYPGRSLLIVSHGAFIKSLLSHIEGRHLKDLWLPPSMSNCCHSIIIRNSDGQFTIKQYADLETW